MENNTIINEGAELYQVETIADGIRNTGYKSTYNAIAEIVDNSIEANAKDVLIIGNQVYSNGQNSISEFAFLDNGEGMTDDVLAKCLTIGFSTRRERKGMGRFGVGLPQASFCVAPRVEVYSWTDGIDNAKRVFIDLDLVSDKKQKRIYGPYIESIPEEYSKLIHLNTPNKKYDFSKHGTLVIWKRCDNVNHKKWNTCRRYIAEDLGRKYRWMINDQSVEIATLEIDDLQTFSIILPNDPLFLMKKTQYCVKDTMDDNSAITGEYNEEAGFTEALFEPYVDEDNTSGEVDWPVYYYDKNNNKCESTVKIRFSIVKEKYYSKNVIKKDPGGLPFGKVADKNSGISIVRQGREIDFGFFDFVKVTNNPQYRWWGCEISFGSELDEFFGISNNKQQVILKRIDPEAALDFEGQEPAWLQLNKIISPTLRKMENRNSELRSGSRSGNNGTATTDVSVTIVQAEQENPEVAVPIENAPEEITEEVINTVRQELIDEGYDQDVSMEQIVQYLGSNTRIKYVNRGSRSPFLDYDASLGVLRIIINKDNKFYTDYVIRSYQDENMKLTFELFLAALVKTIYDKNSIYHQAMDSLVDGLNDKLKAYLKNEND